VVSEAEAPEEVETQEAVEESAETEVSQDEEE
jgi:hypothetical protein